MTANNKELKLIPIEHLQRGKFQPRKSYPADSINELAQSIASQGIIEPIVVRQITDQNYEIIAGERRWRAAMVAGLEKVPCLIGNYTDQQAAAITLIENIQRQDLTLLEEADGYQRLVVEFHFSQSEIACLVGKSRSHIANILRLLTLGPLVKEYLQTEQMSLGHARLLVGLPLAQQEKLANLCVQKNWSVRTLEQALRHKHQIKAPSIENNVNDLLNLQTLIAEHLGSPVELFSENNQSGWLKIKFYDHETLDGILLKLGIKI